MEAGRPIPSKAVPGCTQNCSSFGAFSFVNDPINDPDSPLCWGGRHGDRFWTRCGVFDKCRAHTEPPSYAAPTQQRTSLSSRTYLPIAGQNQTKVIGQTPNAGQYYGRRLPDDFLGSLPTTLTADRAKQPARANARASHDGASPTYIPTDDQSVWLRLLMNIGNGIVAAIGWQLWAYAQNVDIFGGRS